LERRAPSRLDVNLIPIGRGGARRSVTAATMPLPFFTKAGGGRKLPHSCAMSAFPVSPEKENQLAQRMAALGVREADIEETFCPLRRPRRTERQQGFHLRDAAASSKPAFRSNARRTRQQGLNRFIARACCSTRLRKKKNGFIAAQRAEIEKNPPPETETLPPRQGPDASPTRRIIPKRNPGAGRWRWNDGGATLPKPRTEI